VTQTSKEQDSVIEQVEELIISSEYEKALSSLLTILSYPSRPNDWEKCWALAGQIVEKLGYTESSKDLFTVSINPDDSQAVLDLALNLYEQKQHGLALTLLFHLEVEMSADPNFIAEISVNLENLMLHKDAAEFLKKHQYQHSDSFFINYLLCFNLIMSGQWKDTRLDINALNKLVDDENDQYKMEVIQGFLSRTKALAGSNKMDLKDLSAWHTAINGGALLNISPYGFNEGMNGRYAMIQDSYELCMTSILKVEKLLIGTEKNITTVAFFPDRSSEVLATAAGLHLGLPTIPLTKAGDNTLVVVYSTQVQMSEEQLIFFRDHRPNQVFWEHASNWLSPFPFCPDISSYLCQFNTAPWEEKNSIDPKSRETIKVSADKAKASELAKKILACSSQKNILNPKDIKGQKSTEDIILANKKLPETFLPGLLRKTGLRHQFHKGSPVTSSYFT